MRDLDRRDWNAIGQRMLEAAAASLAEAARARAGAAPDAITARLDAYDTARITTQDPGLVARARGAPGRPPESFMTPTAADLAQARARMSRILQQDRA
jgi:hypothetical protein